MIQIDLPMPSECENAYWTTEREPNDIFSRINAWWPCPCYDNELMECRAVVPNRTLYDPDNGINELRENHRPVWCPLKEVKEE